MDNLAKAYLSLALTPGLGPRKIKLLTEHLGDAEKILAASAADLREVEGIGNKLIEAILRAQDSPEADKELARARHLGVTILPLSHPEYPEALRQIFDPPTVLYVRGQLPVTLKGEISKVRAIGIVGTRNASHYALSFSGALGKQLAKAGVAVVSGLALGVDSAAHQGSINTEAGQTVAVLGSGVDVIYPRQNQALAKKILAGHGAIVSEYPLGTEPRAQHFPGRNRIINGLARGVVVVEAGHKSGALITADYALEEGRTVFAVPGRVGDPNTKGVLELIRQGAVLTQSVEDILNEFGWEQDGLNPTGPSLTQLNEGQRKIVELIQQFETPLLDDLINASKLSAAELLPTLTLLELQGIIKTVPGGRYIVIGSV